MLALRGLCNLIPVCLLVGLAVFKSDIAAAQQAPSIHYRLSPGCPWANPKEMPESTTLDQLRPCFNTSASSQSTTPPPPSPPSGDTRRFRSVEARDISGNDIQQLANGTLEACVNACRTNRQCQG